MISLVAAILTGKIIGFLTRVLKIGGGSAAPGLYALKLHKNLIKDLSQDIQTHVIITGTNGKTTTSRLLNHLLRKNQIKTIHNSTGSNLERGIASTLLTYADLSGRIKGIDVAIWEVDEAAFNQVTQKIKPSTVVFLNAFRDQLDRYGEVDSVVTKWRETISKIKPPCLFIANGDDTNASRLFDKIEGDCLLYGVKGLKIVGEHPQKTPRSERMDYQAEKVKLNGLSGSDFELKGQQIHLPLPGLYQIYNFLAAFSVYHNLNLPIDKVNQFIQDFKTPFGRAETVYYKDKKIAIMLIKNPVGATSVFETISSELKAETTVLIALNDNFADGKDVSWIWDAEFERFKIQDSRFKIICSGSRAPELAVRLKYSGVNPENILIEEDLSQAFEKAVSTSNGQVFVLSTYTALLEIQKLLAQKKVKSHYWKEE